MSPFISVVFNRAGFANSVMACGVGCVCTSFNVIHKSSDNINQLAMDHTLSEYETFHLYHYYM